MQDKCGAPINTEDHKPRDSGISTNINHEDKPAIIVMANQKTTIRVTLPQEGSAATAPQGILAEFQYGTEHRDDRDPQDGTREEEWLLVI